MNKHLSVLIFMQVIKWQKIGLETFTIAKPGKIADLLFFKASFLFVSGALVQRNKAQGSREDSNRTLW